MIPQSHIKNLEWIEKQLDQIANAGARVFSELVLSTLRDSALCIREALPSIKENGD